ncbi:hypothetical protein CVS40_2689 [Lucilia cuprina]|nr:hypothetical protein CVS40_2689 [Lucilia cuprina]
MAYDNTTNKQTTIHNQQNTMQHQKCIKRKSIAKQNNNNEFIWMTTSLLSRMCYWTFSAHFTANVVRSNNGLSNPDRLSNPPYPKEKIIRMFRITGGIQTRTRTKINLLLDIKWLSASSFAHLKCQQKRAIREKTMQPNRPTSEHTMLCCRRGSTANIAKTTTITTILKTHTRNLNVLVMVLKPTRHKQTNEHMSGGRQHLGLKSIITTRPITGITHYIHIYMHSSQYLRTQPHQQHPLFHHQQQRQQ